MVIKLKKIILTALFVVLFIFSISSVSSVDMDNENIIAARHESFDLSEVSEETHIASNEALSDKNLASDDDLFSDQDESSILTGPKVKGDVDVSLPKGDDDIGGPDVDIKGPKVDIDVPDVDVEGPDWNSSSDQLIVKKIWEGNYSGDIEEIEIQLLVILGFGPKIYGDVDVSLPKGDFQFQQQATFNDYTNPGLSSDKSSEVVILSNGEGVLTSYSVVETVKLTKNNNWTHVFNVSYSAYKDSSGEWVLSNSNMYMINEITPNNTILVSSKLVKYIVSPDEKITAFWNLTNRVIPNETNNETTNKTPETNQTVNETESFNETEEDEFEFVEPGFGKGPGSSNETPSGSTEDSTSTVSKENVGKTATGNPIFVLLIVLFSMILVPTLRKK